MASIIIGVVGVLAAFVGLDFWWKADQALGVERARRRELEDRLSLMPTIPPTLDDSDGAGGSAYLVVWRALTTPNIEVMCAAPNVETCDAQMDQVLRLINLIESSGRRVVGAGRSSLHRRPGMIRLENGSRILFRFAYDERSFVGLRSQLTWWSGPDPMPSDLKMITLPAAR